MKKALNAIGNYFKNIGIAFVRGDVWVKLSAVLMGAGYFARKQVMNGIIMFLVEALFAVLCVGYAAPNLAKFGTLGTVQFEQMSYTDKAHSAGRWHSRARHGQDAASHGRS